RSADNVRLSPPQNPFSLIEAVDAAGSDNGRGQTCRTHRLPDLVSARNVAPEGARGPDVDCGHAFEPAFAGVRVGRLADARLFGVPELPAARNRQEVHPRPRELDAEVDRIVDAVAAGKDLVAQVTAPDHIVGPHPRPHGGKHLQGQPYAMLFGAAVAV